MQAKTILEITDDLFLKTRKSRSQIAKENKHINISWIPISEMDMAIIQAMLYKKESKTKIARTVGVSSVTIYDYINKGKLIDPFKS